MNWTAELFAAATGCTVMHSATVMPGLLQAMAEAHISDTIPRCAMFLAQCGHESSGFTRVKEGLDYATPERLMHIFGRLRFPSLEFARQYLHAPEKLARYVYGTPPKSLELGNLDEADGWLFIARGYIGTTGRHNYEQLQLATQMRCVDEPEILERPLGAARSATFFWKNRELNQLVDAGADVAQVTARINKGLAGLLDRQARHARAFMVLEAA